MTTAIESMSPAEFLAGASSAGQLIDVRTPAEWKAGHIPEAHHIELAKFASVFNNIPRDKDIAITCGSGYRSSLAASLLKKEGFSRVANVQGGMQAWIGAKGKTVAEE